VIIVALSLVALLGLTGLVVDGGNMMATRRRAQNAADSAALAGAVALLKEGSTNRARNDALLYAQDNGFLNSGTDDTVTVNCPPVFGPHAGDTNCVQVQVYKELPSYFIRLLIQRKPSVLAQATATISKAQGEGDGLIVLDPERDHAMEITQDAIVEVANGGIAVNSNDKEALLAKDRSRVQGTRIRVTGGTKIDGGTVQASPVTGVPPVADPLAMVPEPDPQTLGLRTFPGLKISLDKNQPKIDLLNANVSSASGVLDVHQGQKAAVVLSPGIYTGGMELKDVPVIMQPGIYYLDGGGLKMEGTASLSGTGITLFNGSRTSDFGGIELKDYSKLNIEAPLDGIYKDIILFQARNNDKEVKINSMGSIVALRGAFYLPKARYNVNEFGGTLNMQATQFIVGSIKMGGNSSLRVNFDRESSVGRAQVELVE
jgi:hypothetical protein